MLYNGEIFSGSTAELERNIHVSKHTDSVAREITFIFPNCEYFENEKSNYITLISYQIYMNPFSSSTKASFVIVP